MQVIKRDNLLVGMTCERREDYVEYTQPLHLNLLSRHGKKQRTEGLGRLEEKKKGIKNKGHSTTNAQWCFMWCVHGMFFEYQRLKKYDEPGK